MDYPANLLHFRSRSNSWSFLITLFPHRRDDSQNFAPLLVQSSAKENIKGISFCYLKKFQNFSGNEFCSSANFLSQFFQCCKNCTNLRNGHHLWRKHSFFSFFRQIRSGTSFPRSSLILIDIRSTRLLNKWHFPRKKSYYQNKSGLYSGYTGCPRYSPTWYSRFRVFADQKTGENREEWGKFEKFILECRFWCSRVRTFHERNPSE